VRQRCFELGSIEQASTLSLAVQSAGLTAADVDSVLLLGGSSRIPLAMDAGVRPPVAGGVHPVHAVAFGAAASAVQGG
jgi:molecular chaperone DnaK